MKKIEQYISMLNLRGLAYSLIVSVMASVMMGCPGTKLEEVPPANVEIAVNGGNEEYAGAPTPATTETPQAETGAPAEEAESAAASSAVVAIPQTPSRNGDATKTFAVAFSPGILNMHSCNELLQQMTATYPGIRVKCINRNDGMPFLASFETLYPQIHALSCESDMVLLLGESYGGAFSMHAAKRLSEEKPEKVAGVMTLHSPLQGISFFADNCIAILKNTNPFFALASMTFNATIQALKPVGEGILTSDALGALSKQVPCLAIAGSVHSSSSNVMLGGMLPIPVNTLSQEIQKEYTEGHDGLISVQSAVAGDQRASSPKLERVTTKVSHTQSKDSYMKHEQVIAFMDRVLQP